MGITQGTFSINDSLFYALKSKRHNVDYSSLWFVSIYYTVCSKLEVFLSAFLDESTKRTNIR